MDNLVAIAHEDGLELLKNELYEQIKKFELIDDEDVVYFSETIHSSYFDENKVLTIEIIIPKEEHFSNWNKLVRIKSNDEKIVADIQTPAIQFVTGVGGVQVIKLTVSGNEPNEIIFKKDNYITVSEANNIFIKPLISNTSHTLFLQNKLIEQGVINV